MVRAPLHFHGRIPVPEVAPLTYRDGVTHLELVYELSQYLKHVLHPSLQSTIDQVVADAEQLLSDATAQYVDGVQEFQRIHDAFMSDVNASLIALNDGAVSDLVKDETSRVGEVLRELFTSHEVLDTTVTAVRNEMSLLESKTNEKVSELSDTVDGNVDELQGRLSQNSLETSFDTRSRLNTKVVDGDTPVERLAQTVSEGEPVQFDEHGEHTGNIDGFWDTTIYGTGTITTPDGGVFHVEPVSNDGQTVVNTLYVNQSTGTSSHDGLTPDTPLDSLQSLYSVVLQRLTTQQRNGARWVIRMSGTFTQGIRFYHVGDYPHGLVFQGDAPHNGHPTTTIQQGTDTSESRPFWIEPGIDTVEFYDLHFKGWNGAYGYGIYMRFGGRIVIERCEFTDCTYGAAAIQNTTFIFDNNVVHENVRTGFRAQYNSSGHANNNIMTGGSNGRYGVDMTRNSVAHVDNNHFTGYSESAIYVDMASRAAVGRNVFEGNEVGVTVTGGAEWANTDNTFYKSNASAYQHHGGGREMRMHSVGDWTGTEYRVGSTNRTYGTSQQVTLTGWSTIYRGFYAGRLPGQWLQWPGKYIRVVMHGYTDTAGARVDIGSDREGSTAFDSFHWVRIPDSGYFTIEAYIYSTAVSAQRTFITVNAGNATHTDSAVSRVNMADRRHMRVRANSGSNSSVSLTTYHMQVFTLG